MSSPPFQVEDQTDADFFDKLVDDEFEGSDSGPSFAPGIESDEVKAFSNLSINEAASVTDGFGDATEEGEDQQDQSKDVLTASTDTPQKDILVSEESVSLVSSNLIPVGTVMESHDATAAANVSSESTAGRGNESKGISIKEVQWNLFNADSDQNGVYREGSADFFTSLDEGGVDPFASLGDSLKVDSFSNSEDNLKAGFDPAFGMTEHIASDSTAFASAQHQDGQVYAASTEQATSGQDLYNSQYWENLYPGWRYDSNTGEWVQVEGYDATANTQASYGETTQAIGNDFVSDQKADVSYLQQSAQSVVGTVAENCTTGSVSTWNQLQPGSSEYPAHMVFDPQYPGWYYDTITQEWCSLESYNSAIQSTSAAQGHQAVQSIGAAHGHQAIQSIGPAHGHQAIQSAGAAHGHHLQSWNNSNGGFSSGEQSLYGDRQVKNYSSQDLSGQNHGGNWAGSAGNYSQPSMNMWQPEAVAKSDALSDYSDHQKLDQLYGSREHLENIQDQHMGFRPVENSFSYEQTSRSNDVVTGFQSFVPSKNSSQPFNSHLVEQNQKKLSAHDLYASQNSGFYSPQMFQSGPQLLSSVNESRSSAGRPPHALATFGFGGKLIVMKDCNSFVGNSAYGNQESGGSISVLNIMDVIGDQNDTARLGVGGDDYFRTLGQQSYPGPLVGGSAGAKEVSKWIDERIVKCESPYTDYRKGQLLRLLLSLLKIASQNYGKLRSPFGTDSSLKGTDGPEKAVAVLFSSSRMNDAQLSGYGATHQCLQNLPTEAQLQATALEVQNLLVSGRRMEALQCAQEGQLWVYAFQLAADLGDQYYLDTAKQMAHRMLVSGSPLKTLSLLMAGQPADIFSVDSSSHGGVPSAVNMSHYQTQTGSNGMLDDWERNLAIMAANRTKGDELVILHLGDCLWKERGENIAAHMCYLLSEAPFESFSDGARLCLIGADHWKFPRTYASPEAIQRTEFYEYSMVLGNSQSVLLPFQPYKLIYAYMLAEVGRLSDSLKYCQATLKALKTNRAPEVDAWKQLLSSLEDRIRTHQQSGFGTNLAPRKLVGKFLPFIDSTIHRMIGPPPPPVPSGNASEHDNHPVGPRVANSQSTMAMQSLIPSASMEPISAWGSGGGTRSSMHNRSISEPDFGRSPRQVDSSKEASSSDSQGKASDSGGPSRFGRFGSSLIQKTMGWVSKSRSDRQAKLGEKNKFYYDEKLKRWVEEGVEAPAAETAPPPPPTAASFQNGTQDYNIRNAFKGDSSPANGGTERKSPSSSERSAGIPPIPPSSNQFSARSRMGVRSRYVDTFNKGGGATTSFSAPSVPAPKPGGGSKAKFFIPTPTSSGEQTAEATSKSVQEDAAKQDPSTFMSKESFSSPSPTPPSMQRFPSMNNLTPTGNNGPGAFDNGNSSLSSRSRRTASWSGSLPGALNAPKANEVRPLGEALGMSPLSSTSSNPSTVPMPMNGGNFGDDLHEVEL